MKTVYTNPKNSISQILYIIQSFGAKPWQFMRILMLPFISNMKLYPTFHVSSTDSTFNMCKITGSSLSGICELVREWKCIHVHRSIIELIFFKETGNRRSGYLILLIFGLQIIRAGFACLLLRIQYYYEVHKNITPFHFVITHKFIRMKCKNTSIWMLFP